MELEGGGGDPHGMQCQISCSRSPSLRAVLTVLCSHQRLAIVDCTCSWLSVPAMVVIASPPYLSSATPSMLPGDECRDEFHISIKAFRWTLWLDKFLCIIRVWQRPTWWGSYCWVVNDATCINPSLVAIHAWPTVQFTFIWEYARPTVQLIFTWEYILSTPF